jgi:signal transduction histidine kinase/CheY-like chemotaxis protein
MLVFHRESLTNLEDLRHELTQSLCVVLIVAGGFLAYNALLREDFPLVAFVIYLFLIAVSLFIHRLPDTRSKLARFLLVGSLTVCLITAMWLIPNPEVVYLGILLTFISAVLINGGEWIVPLLVGGCAWWWTDQGWRVYPIPFLMVFLVMGGVIARLTFSTIHTALKWAWNSQTQAGELLEQTRIHRAELSRSLKSLEQTYLVQRRLQNELIIARNEANAARQMKERFAANISHELRTPLNLILGFSDVMFYTPEAYGEFKWPPKLRRDIYQIHRSSKHLLEMIDDILDLSRYDMVDFTLHRERTSVHNLLKNTIEITSGLFENPDVRLELDLAPDLPELELDRTRIRQVIINLINNARRFTEKGYVRLSAEQNEKEVVICVSDSGPGIPQEELESIFDEFYQVDVSIRRKEQGFGLGLAICERFVSAHQGRIWAESQVGLGSKFFFSLPKLNQVESYPYQAINYPVETEQRPKILVVDPDPAVSTWIRRNLENADIIQVEKPDYLKERINQYHPHTVIFNNNQENTSFPFPADLPVPVIECSLPSQAWMAEDLNVSTVLTKPITPQRLVQEIEKLGAVRKILIVDDSEEFVQLVRRILESTQNDYIVQQAYDGAQGLTALQEFNPDLVLLDLIMPTLDGAQFLKEMRLLEGFNQTAILIITATSHQSFSHITQNGRLVVHQGQHLGANEMAACIRALVTILKPHYNEQNTAPPALV